MVRVHSDVARPLSGHIAARLQLARAATTRCLVDRLGDVLDPSPRPWAPGRREDVDTLASSTRPRPVPASGPERDRLFQEAPLRRHRAGSLLLWPPVPDGDGPRALLLVSGRLRVFRVNEEGRAETTDVLLPGAVVVMTRPRPAADDETFVEALDDADVRELSGEAAHRVAERPGTTR